MRAIMHVSHAANLSSRDLNFDDRLRFVESARSYRPVIISHYAEMLRDREKNTAKKRKNQRRKKNRVCVELR